MAEKGIKKLKLVQLNIWCGRIDNVLRDFLVEEDADIFCGQEVMSYPKGDSILFMPMEEIQQLTKQKYSAFGPSGAFLYMDGKAEFGNVIMSKLPITKSETVFTNLEFVDNFSFEKHDYNIRNFVHAKIDCGEKIVNIITHHGHHVRGHKNGNEDTDRQMQMISDYVSRLDGPVILTGDFNLSSDSKSLEPINNKLTNLSVEYKLKTTRNELTNKTEVCDYIFVNKEVKVKSFYASGVIVSDHQALIIEFDV